MNFKNFFVALLGDLVSILSTIGSLASWAITIILFDKPTPRSISLLIGLGCFVLAAVRAWTREHEERDKSNATILELKKIPAQISVEILELQKEGIKTDSEEANHRGVLQYDIFVRTKLELKNLESVVISRVCAEMSLQGAIEQLKERKDIKDWRLFIGRHESGGASYAYYRLIELKQELKLGIPIEGWLHFVTKPTTDHELNQSSFKLVVETPRGASHQELGANTNKWEQQGGGKIVIDPDTSGKGLPND